MPNSRSIPEKQARRLARISGMVIVWVCIGLGFVIGFVAMHVAHTDGDVAIGSTFIGAFIGIGFDLMGFDRRYRTRLSKLTRR